MIGGAGSRITRIDLTGRFAVLIRPTGWRQRAKPSELVLFVGLDSPGTAFATVRRMMRKLSAADRIGKYELVAFIGRGGMGEVWLAMQLELRAPCVIKVMLPELSADPEYREMFVNEARIASQLQDPHIVPVTDIGEVNGLLYLVMPRIDGVNLAYFMKVHREQAGPINQSIVAYIIHGILQALEYAHDRKLDQRHDVGVIHHDITPNNILLSSHGAVLLTDFGIARFAGVATLASRPIGTLRYMAPEQLLGRTSRQSDLYSTGVILHELLTGSPPLPKCSNIAELKRALLLDPTPDTGRDDVDSHLDRLRRALLQKTLEKRLRSANDGVDMVRRVPGAEGAGHTLKWIFSRLIGPPSTGMTQYLQRHSTSNRGSFLAPLLTQWRQRDENLARDSEAVSAGSRPPVAPVAPVAPEVGPALGASGRVVSAVRWDDRFDGPSSVVEEHDDDGDGQIATRRWGERLPVGTRVSPTSRLATMVSPPREAVEDETKTSRYERPDGDQGSAQPDRVLGPLLHRKARLQHAAVPVPVEPTPRADPSSESGEYSAVVRIRTTPLSTPIGVEQPLPRESHDAQARYPSGGSPSVPSDAARTMPQDARGELHEDSVDDGRHEADGRDGLDRPCPSSTSGLLAVAIGLASALTGGRATSIADRDYDPQAGPRPSAVAIATSSAASGHLDRGELR